MSGKEARARRARERETRGPIEARTAGGEDALVRGDVALHSGVATAVENLVRC
jgi:hypothetical protein